MGLTLTFEIELLSDYHVSSGAGFGPLTDSTLLRDRDGSPTLRGTTIAGLLRQGLRDLAQLPPLRSLSAECAEVPEAGPDGGANEPLLNAMERLFGSVARRKRWAFSTARVNEHPMRKQGTRWGATDVARIRINPRTRRAEPQKLFRQEEGQSDLRFRFTATCPSSHAQDIRDAALLVAAARMVQALGAARRRGRGACVIRLVAADGWASAWGSTEEALDAFHMAWLTEGGATEESFDARAFPSAPLRADPVRFHLLLYLTEPLIISLRNEAGNTYEGMSFIPGTTLLGALASRAALSMNLGDEADARFIALFLRGGVRVTPLYPAVRGEEQGQAPHLIPTIPLPLSLVHDKNRPAEGDKIVAEAGEFLTVAFRPNPVSPLRHAEMHIRLEPDTGRVVSGNLYEYFALAPGQWFVGEMECAEGVWPDLAAHTGLSADQATEIRLGKASQRGYGAAQLFLRSAPSDAPLEIWMGKPFLRRSPEPGDATFHLTLLTDTILLDPWGRAYRGFEASWLAPLLGVELATIAIKSQHCQSRPVGSFHAHRRLPRWRDHALAAGSTAEIVVMGHDLTALSATFASLEREGIGLRRQEGFGRVAINHPLVTPGSYQTIPLAGVALPEQKWVTANQDDPVTFHAAWRTELEEGKWHVLKAEHAVLARLIALSYPFTPEQVQRWLQEVATPSYLWGKTKRERKPVSDPATALLVRKVKALGSLLERQGLTGEAWQRGWREGLGLLAEQIMVKIESETGGDNGKG